MRNPDNKTPHMADEYDLQVLRTIPYYDCLHDETINLVRAIRPKPRVWLDTGCGTGTLVEKAAALFENTRFLLADPSENMLRLSKIKLEKCKNIEFLKPANSVHLPEYAGEIDVITAIQSHHYMSKEDRIIATARCHEMLDAGGLFITFENIRPCTETGKNIAMNYWRSFQLRKGRSTDVVEKHLQRFDTEYFPITLKDHFALYELAGFKTVELFWYSYMQAGFYCIK